MAGYSCNPDRNEKSQSTITNVSLELNALSSNVYVNVFIIRSYAVQLRKIPRICPFNKSTTIFHGLYSYLIDHKYDVKIFVGKCFHSKVLNILTSFLWPMIEQIMESCCRFVFLQWLWHFWGPFPLKFLGKSLAKETTNAPLSGHFHCLYFGNLRSGPILPVLVHSLLRAPAKIGPDPKSHKLARAAARYWRQRWLAVRTIPRDLIGCWNQRKLKVLIPRVAYSTKQSSWMIRRQRREGLCFCLFVCLFVFSNCFTVLR